MHRDYLPMTALQSPSASSGKGWTAIAVLLVAAGGCSNDADDNPATTGDTGVMDAASPMDASTGTDGGGGLPQHVDGDACQSSFSPSSFSFAQDDCGSGLLCIPWDLVAEEEQLTGPVQSCVLPCTVDADCGQNPDGSRRHCVDSGFNEASGAPRICVDEVADVDQYCGYSRLSSSRVPDVPIRTPGAMIGCRAGIDCIQRFFEDVHVSEGVCGRLCSSTAECAGSGLPYCNPAAIQIPDGGTTVGIGICSDRQRGLGALCGTADAASAGFSTRCDTSVETPAGTMCVPGESDLLGFDLPEGLGICATICNANRPCGNDPVLGPMTCSDLFLTFLGESIGLCGTGCTRFPDNCGGAGGRGGGRFCGPAAAAGAEFCIDVEPPTLRPGEIVNGVRDETVGDDCLADGNRLSCPPGSSCIPNSEGTRGWCYYGCSTDPNAPPVCNDLLNVTESTCAMVLNTVNPEGLCSVSR